MAYRQLLKSSKKVRRALELIIIHLLLISGAIVMLIPLVWMLSTALKPLPETFAYPPKWIPKPIVWSNFVEGLTVLPFGTFFKNSIIITVAAIIGGTLTASFVAFGFARLDAPGRNILFIILLSTMMIPGQVTMIPTYILFSKLRWIDTFLPLIVPSYFGGGAFYIFLLRQFYMTIPLELDEAAHIDGCSYLGIYRRIIIPLSKPALTAIVIFSFMGHWNEFLTPLIYLNSVEKFTVPLGLGMFRNLYQIEPPWNYIMAVSLVALLPCLAVFFFAQRHFIQGITMTGLKG